MQHYQRLRDVREDTGKSQEEIAGLLNVKQQQYGRWEKGIHELPMHHFITLARFYNVSLDYLSGLIDQPKPLYTDPDVVNLMKRTYPMPDKARKDTI